MASMPNLTADQIRFIREKKNSANFSVGSLAISYGVPRKVIRDIWSGKIAIAEPEKQIPPPWEPTDAEKLGWLSRCASVKTDGVDGGWTFSFLYVDMDNNVGPTDITLSVRGYRDLSESVAHAMRLERGIGK